MLTDNKLQYVIDKNTFFFKNDEFEELYDSEINQLVQLLLTLKKEIDINGLRKETIYTFIKNKPTGLIALLTLFGFSKESLLRLITFIRVVESDEISQLVFKDKWNDNLSLETFREWDLAYICRYIQRNQYFGLGLVNLFLEGGACGDIRKRLPLFEYKKLDIGKLNFEIDSLLDTIVRYRAKGSYKAISANNPEELIKILLTNNNVPFQKGNGFRKIVGRDMDFVIPTKNNPKILIECSYVTTTASGMGDKASNEFRVAMNIKRHFNDHVRFWGFVDGVGWYVRRSDLKNLVSAFENVYTFNPGELDKFLSDVKGVLEM